MKKIINTLLMVIILEIIFMPIVTASSIKFIAMPDKTTLEAGDTVSINLKISDIDAGKLGVNTLSCLFQYDESLFEDIKITPKNNWSITYNSEKDNEKYGALLAVLVSPGITEEQEIGEITLKVKKDTEGKTGNITFTKILSNDGENYISDKDKTINIKISQEKKTTISGKIENIIGGILPQTGYSEIILVFIFIVAFITIICYIIYRKK